MSLRNRLLIVISATTLALVSLFSAPASAQTSLISTPLDSGSYYVLFDDSAEPTTSQHELAITTTTNSVTFDDSSETFSSVSGNCIINNPHSVTCTNVVRFLVRLGSKNDNIVISGPMRGEIASGSGTNSVDASASSGGITFQSNGIDTLHGGSAGDTFFTYSASNSSLYGGEGNDNFQLYLGSSHAYGEAGSDYMLAQKGVHNMDGGMGNDTLVPSLQLSGSHVDSPFAGSTWLGGDGDDRIVIGNTDGVIINGGSGNDRLEMQGGDFGNRLEGDISGGADSDQIYAASQAITISLDDAKNDSFVGSTYTANLHSDIEKIYGTNYDDQITGSANADYIDGQNGNDIIDGAAGDDTLIGSFGNDSLTGGAGVDTIGDAVYNEPGDDTIDINDIASADNVICGTGNDLLKFDLLDYASKQYPGCESKLLFGTFQVN